MLDLSKRTAQLLVTVSVILATGLVGCTTTYPQDPSRDASAAIDAAKAAGKDRQCPDEFNAAEKAKTDAYAICQPCDMAKAIAQANEALAKANGAVPGQAGRRGRGPRRQAGSRADRPLRAPPPTVSLSASPNSDPEGPVLDSDLVVVEHHERDDRPGNREGGFQRLEAGLPGQDDPVRHRRGRRRAGPLRASTTVTVNKVVDQMTIHVNFDFNKATIRKAGRRRPPEGHRLHQEVPRGTRSRSSATRTTSAATRTT